MNNITSKKEKVNTETIKNDTIVKLPWVPKPGPKLRKEFTSRRNLKNLICRNTENCFLIAFLVFIN